MFIFMNIQVLLPEKKFVQVPARKAYQPYGKSRSHKMYSWSKDNETEEAEVYHTGYLFLLYIYLYIYIYMYMHKLFFTFISLFSSLSICRNCVLFVSFSKFILHQQYFL
jgi:hypothetical protein